MQSIAIRKAEEASDLQHVLDVVLSYSPSADEWHHLRKSLEEEFAELDGNRHVYIAWDGAQPIGTYQLILNNADNDRALADGATVAHVHHLRVLKDRRRHGLGRRLMLHAESEARTLGRQRLTVGVDSWNDAAIAFYTALGYDWMKEADGPAPDVRVLYLKKDRSRISSAKHA